MAPDCSYLPGEPLRLVKYQALGNDYLVVDDPSLLQALVPILPRLLDRHTGLGADGLLLFDPALMTLRVFNPDGSEAEKSGNGLRIAACHAVLEHGAPDQFEIATRDRVNQVRIQARAGNGIVCEVSMGKADFSPDRWLHLDTAAGVARCRAVDVGNPHCVVFDQPVTMQRCLELGPALEGHPNFLPRRTNVQLVQVVAPDRARIEIWERGAGRTQASGSSAAAVGAILIHLQMCEPSLAVEMEGGVLLVRQDLDGCLFQTGPAQRVYRAEVDLTDFA